MKLRILGLLLTLSACTNPKIENTYPSSHKDLYRFGSILGSQGIKIGGINDDKKIDENAIKVNRYLWHASLDVLSSILPITSADPYAGAIITDWHTLVENPNEMFKIVVTIDSKELRADALSLKIYKKVKNLMDKWQNSNVSKDTIAYFENAILSRASELRQKDKK
ncbi:MAG: DUF3576 domain-containing protein [Alphaproteobacteria bacterium]|nr:DUF3576 domain-containing protein [Alphaproteobacteria bacterium]